VNRWAALLKSPPIELLDMQGIQLDALKATDINSRHFLAVRAHSLPERMDATFGTEVMLYHMLVERVRADVFPGRE
jgi:hypothetical protein